MNSVSSRTEGLTLTGVMVRRQSNIVTVILRGHGPFRYQVVLVDTSQLALDFPEGVSLLSFHTLSVRHRFLKEVDIRQHPKKLRLVFTLHLQVRYAVKVNASFLAIQFRL